MRIRGMKFARRVARRRIVEPCEFPLGQAVNETKTRLSGTAIGVPKPKSLPDKSDSLKGSTSLKSHTRLHMVVARRLAEPALDVRRRIPQRGNGERCQFARERLDL